MPTHSLPQFVESPDGLAQDILISNDANVPGPGCSMTPHAVYSEKAALQSGGGAPLSCMFCDQTFTHQDELGPHVLTQHPTTFFEPAVLRVEAEFRIPGERPRSQPSGFPVDREEVHSCIVCGQVSHDAAELETHTRKHKDYFTYCCGVCGRRFREPWFLKNHVKMHVKSGAKGKAQQDLETPVTVNDVVQVHAPEPVVTAYKMCMVCGFFFPDHDGLAEHSKVHNREAEPGKDKDEEKMDVATESSAEQESFLRGLNLKPRPTGTSLQLARSSKWIPQLDPFNTYQAWQLATKGKIAVGPNNMKDVGQEASTDNEECGSDKEESSHIWAEGQGDKATKALLGRELKPQQQPTVVENAAPQRRSLLQKNKVKERPTTCPECQRTFRTYHQLVLHSRVHKRERGGGGEESPTSSVDGKLSRAGSVEQTEEGCEEGLEEAASMAEHLAPGEDGFDRSKVRSKACSYCAKSFRSSYYLTVHLRTHTGEKPFKCAYCDYAAAQKTSLKYHLDRRHKDKPFVDIPSRPAPSVPSPRKHANDNDTPAPNRSTLWIPATRPRPDGTPVDRFDGGGSSSELGQPPAQIDAEDGTLIAPAADGVVECPKPVNLKVEREEMKDETSEAPLNLSLKVSLSGPASAEPRIASTPLGCSLCPYQTMYPEVLMMHRKLAHKEPSDGAKKSGFGNLKAKRLTGCPPALEGKDVGPLAMIDRRHPRRTKSPPPQPAKPEEKTPVKPALGPKRSPGHAAAAAAHDAVEETPLRCAQTAAAAARPTLESSRFTDLMRKSNAASKYAAERPGPPDRVGIGERSYPARSGVIWHADAARLCLSSRFGSLPQMDFGEPSGKRSKYALPKGREADGGEKPGFRGPAGSASNRLLLTGRSAKTAAQMSRPSAVSDALGSLTSSAAIGGGLDSEWSVMNLLRSYTPSDLAALYHGSPVNPGHGGLANPRAGGRAVLYQHVPSLSSLQRRDPSGPFPHQRYGTTDKNT